MNIHVMIAEDEQMARKELVYLLEKEADVHLCPSAETGTELVELYQTHEPDVIFLDVQMPGLTGIEAAREISALSPIQPPLFIFTTAFDEYALDAFEFAAVDYLLKPYDEERFHTAIERVRKRLNKMEKDFVEQANRQATAQKLLIDDGEKMVVLSPESIYYAMPYNRMLEVHTEEKVIKSRLSLQELENKLTGYAFFRTHRSYLVNLDHVLEITPWFNGTSNVTLNDNAQTTIPVSRAARKVLFKHFDL